MESDAAVQVCVCVCVRVCVRACVCVCVCERAGIPTISPPVMLGFQVYLKEPHDLHGDFRNTRIYCSGYLHSYNVNHTSSEKTRVSDHITIGYRFLKPPAATASSFPVYRTEFWGSNLI